MDILKLFGIMVAGAAACGVLLFFLLAILRAILEDMGLLPAQHIIDLSSWRRR